MRRALILVEGQTEERFVKEVLQPHLWTKGVHIDPKILSTKRVKSGGQFKGGVTSFGKVKNDLRLLLKDSGAALVTTMLDYYGLPDDFPGRNSLSGRTPQERVAELQAAMDAEIGAGSRFRAFLMLHEFEALLFVLPPALAGAMNMPQHVDRLHAIRQSFPTPEDINDGSDTHPSKRITDIFPQYRKRLHGPMVAGRVGLERLRGECPHFGEWLSLLEKLGT